jgi:putative transposase
MDEYESLSHTTWTCKYHVVFIPKCRRKALYQELRRHLGEVFRKLALQKESKVEEGHLMSDHVHMLLSVPPKYAVSQVVGYIKGKSAIHLAGSMGSGALPVVFIVRIIVPGVLKAEGARSWPVFT